MPDPRSIYAEDPNPTAAPDVRGKTPSVYDESSTDRLSDAIARAPSTPATTAARIFRLQQKTGLPQEVITRNLDLIEKQAAAVDFDPVTFRKASPQLASWLEQHPLHSSLAGDDMVPLTAMEHTLRFGENAARATTGGFVKGANLGFWSLLEAGGDVFGNYDLSNWAKQQNAWAQETAAGVKGEQLGAGYYEKVAYSGFESIGTSLPILAVTVLTKNPTLALSLMGTQTGGQAYTDARAQGVPVAQALAFGTAQGMIEAWTESLGTKWLIKDLGAHAGLFKTLAHQMVSEGFTEQVATAGQDLMEWATLHPGTPFSDYVAARPQAALDTALAVGVTVVGQGGAAHTLNRVVSGLATRRLTTDLNESIQQSKLLKTSPAKLQEFLAGATKDTPNEFRYADPKEWVDYWRGNGEDPGARAAQLGISQDAFDDAVATGADLEIPMAAFSVQMADHAGTWADLLREAPGEMNAQETEQFLADLQAQQPAEGQAPAGPAPLSVSEQMQADLTAHLVERADMHPLEAHTNAALLSSLFKTIESVGLNPQEILDRRFAGTTLETAPGERPGAPPGPELNQGGLLNPDEARALLAVPETVRALDRRQTQREIPLAGLERRGATKSTEDILAELQHPDAPIDTTNIGAAALQMVREDPTIRVRAAEMQKQAQAAPRAKGTEASPYTGTPTFWGYEPGPDGAPLAKFTVQTETGPTQIPASELERYGLPVPGDVPPPPAAHERLSGDELRRRAIAARGKPEVLYQTVPEQGTVPAPVFFSRIVRAVEESSLAKAPGAQWAATIKNAKSGISQDEATVLRLDQLDPAQVYTKQEMLDYLAANVLAVEIVELSGESVDEDDLRREMDSSRDSQIDSEVESLRDNYDKDEEIERIRDQFEPPETRTQLVEGDEDTADHYLAYVDGDPLADWDSTARKEVPIQFDSEAEADDAINERLSELEDEYVDSEFSEPDFYEQARDYVDSSWDSEEERERAIENLGGGGSELGVHYEEYSVGGPKEDYREIFVTVPEVPASAMPTGPALLDEHATISLGPVVFGTDVLGSNREYEILANGEPVPLAVPGEARRDQALTVYAAVGMERESALDNAVAIYHAERQHRERASTRHTAGWQDGHDAYEDILNPVVRLRVSTRESSLGKTLFIEEAQPPHGDEPGHVNQQAKMPPLLIKNWRELAMKYALRHAAENGHAAVAWATGLQTAAHYSLNRIARTLTWGPVDELRDDGYAHFLDIVTKDHGTIRLGIGKDGLVMEASEKRLIGASLAAVVGKPAAEAIAAKPKGGEVNADNLAMSISPGLMKIYEEDLRNVTNKLAVVKKTKGRVTTATIATKDQARGARPLGTENPAVGIVPRGTPPHQLGGWSLLLADGAQWGHYDEESHALQALTQWQASQPSIDLSSRSVNQAIEMTPELTAAVLGGQPMFQSAPDGRKAQLEQLATDEAMGVNFEGQQGSELPDGSSALNCTNCARRIIELNGGQGEIYGWEEGSNNTSVVAGPAHGARLADGQGHDFAVIDGRYLVDAWAKNVEGSSPRAVFDLNNPVDVQEVRRLYGDPTTWLKAANPMGVRDMGFAPGMPAQLAAAPLNQPQRRASITFDPETGKAAIALFALHDRSSFIHEFGGHLHLEMLGDVIEQLGALDPATLTDAQRRLVDDYRKVLLPWLGTDDRPAGPHATRFSVAQHERWADGVEDYLMTNRAPSLELQPIFARVKAWMLDVYRLVKRDVQLTPEVRTFMDRLLATDDAIAAVEAQGAIAPIFTTAEEAGKTREEWALYRKTVEAASIQAREKLAKKTLADLRREQSTLYAAQRQALRDTIERELQAQPVYRALAAIRQGTHPDGTPLVAGQEVKPLKLDRALVVAAIGEAATKTLPKPYVYSKEGGIDPGFVAEMFGFSDAGALLNAIGRTPKLETVLELQTEQRMITEHGGLLTDGTLPAEAQEAVANDGREQVIRAEIRALQKLQRTVGPHVRLAEKPLKAQVRALTGQVEQQQRTAERGPGTIARAIPSAVAINEAAQLRLARTPIRDLHPQNYWHAAQKANREALAAAARQDFDAAITAHTQQLIALASYRATQKALADITQRVNGVKALDSVNSRKRLGLAGQTYQDQVDGFLDRYEFAKVSDVALRRRAGLREWAASMAGLGYPVQLTDAQLDDAKQVNYRELPYAELITVTDAIDQIVHLAQLKNRLLDQHDTRTFGEQRDGIVDAILTHHEQRPQPLEPGRPEQQAKRTVADWIASHRKLAFIVNALDGYVDGGPFWEAFIRPINAAADAEIERKTVEGRAFWAIVQAHYPGRELTALNKKSPVPGLGESLSKEGRLAVALNYGNPNGRERLLNDPARKWTGAQVTAILDTLDARDWRFVQDTWKFNERFWPEIAALEQRVTGIAPAKVGYLPFQTKTGGLVPGGYYHIGYDSRLSPGADQHETANLLKFGAQASYVRAATRQGFVEEQKASTGLALKLELGVEFTHIEEVIHSLTHRELISDVSRLLRDRKVRDAIVSTQGDLVYKQLTLGVQDIALGTLPAAKTIMEKAASFAKSGTQISQLAFNVWTALQQPFGWFNGMEEIGPKYVAKGMVRWLRSANDMEGTIAWVAENSVFMRNRWQTSSQEFTDLRAVLRKPGGWFDTLVRTVSADQLTQQTILDSYLWHIAMMQRVADMPVWLGAFEKFSEEFPRDEAKAIALADQAILNSQGGGQIKDLAQVQRGGPIARLYMAFYSYGNMTINQAGKTVGRVKSFKSPAQVARMLGGLTLIYVAPAMMTIMVAHAFGRGRDDDDWSDYFGEVGRESLATAMNGIVALREFAGLLGDGNRGYAGPAGARMAEVLYGFGQQAKQFEPDEAFFKSLNQVGGMLVGYPAAQLQKMAEGFQALQSGRAHNPLVLLTGPPPKKKK